MLAAAEAVVAGEHDEGILPQPHLLQLVEQPSHVRIHRRHCGEVPFQHLPVTETALGQPLPFPPWVHRLLRTGIESAVVV